FGIAKLLDPLMPNDRSSTRSGTRLGTPSNMAPEQILGHAVDARTDIYALGLLLFHVLSGHLPFRAETSAEVEELHLTAPPPRVSTVVSVPQAMDRVIERCLEKDPAKRYASVGDLLQDLRVALSGRRTSRHADAQVAMGIGLHVEVRTDALS